MGGTLTLFFGMGLLAVMIGLIPASTRLTCSRSLKQVSCRLQRPPLLGTGEISTIANVSGSEVVTDRERQSSRRRRNSFRQNNDRYETVYRVRLTSSTGEKPLVVRSSDNRNTIDATNTTLQSFLSGQTSSLYLQHSDYLVILIGSLVALGSAVGGLVGIAAPVVTCTFYRKVMQKVVIERRRLWETEVREYPLDNVHHVDQEEKHTKSRTVYRTVLVTANERIPLHQDFTDEQSASEITYKVRQFLER